jgi:hypothetical protein
MRTALLLAALLLIAPALSAQLEVGDEVPDHHVDFWINTPAWTQFSDLRGDVIVFKKWGMG